MYAHVKQLETRLSRTRPETGARRTLPRPALAFLTWLGAYVVITLIPAVLGPVIGGWPPALRTLLLSGLMVGTLTSIVMPILMRLFLGWLVMRA